MTTDDPGLGEVLSTAVGRAVTVWPRQPADNHDFFRRRELVSEPEAREQLGLLPDEPLPDYHALPPGFMEHFGTYVAPFGVYFDAFPLSLLTTTSMRTLGDLAPESIIDTRRFRQNVIMEGASGLEGFAEFGWVGRRLQLGSVVVQVVAPMSRCSIVTLPQAELPHDRALMRTLVRETNMDLGVYLTIVQPGEIAEGDDVNLLD